MFSLRAFVDGISPDGHVSRIAAFHYAQTLQHLQARINAFEHGQRDSVLADSTVMVIVTLAMAAEITGDLAAAQSHVEGLLTIVNLKGGLRSLNTHNNVQVKVCRADLGLALRMGSRARLFQTGISWDCFLANRGLVKCNHGTDGAQVDVVVNKLDPKLGNCWKDIHAFSCLSNLAYQTTRKLSPDVYNEMMVSILYRLTRLSFEDDLLQDMIRIGLLVYCSTLFLTRQYLERPYERLCNLFDAALLRLCQVSANEVPLPPLVLLWLLILRHLVAYQERCSESDSWQTVWLDKAVVLTGVDTWLQAQRVLRSVMWVDFVHDERGKECFDASRMRSGPP
ncbi:hypothetical protein A1O1_04156 [Capronia coronata CBS 617.96]|uniref:Transcription factor domain-containing protein n=1 Tax=Capronia coronata CBS 617.96 TaxID=1182541 RepID=W9Z962_9EURO|nr:uncharacterized protein A1O1_04156 [Capronia coronata CBS 617.96]EXJ91049.1 hypothetical protein A1O1_04156 [Capronia coronata CBS 617.96]